MLRQYGAKEIHFRVSSPPTAFPCFYGIDTKTREELIASSQTVDGINSYMESDTLQYLTIDGMKRALGNGEYTYCDACFSGEYPSKFPLGMKLEQMELFVKK
jgi:amidophosphoribosyltransferase